jgi:hypothetical protein
MSWFPAAFRLPASACRVILFPPWNWAFLTVGLPDRRCPDPDGVTTVRTARYERGGCLLDPGDGGALPAGCRARPAPAASQQPVPFTPHLHPTSRAPFYEASTEVHAIHPPGLPLACDPPDGTAVLGLSPVLRTPPLPAAHDRAGPGVSTRPELRDRHNRPSNPRVHSLSATSCRNGRCGNSRGEGLYEYSGRGVGLRAVTARGRLVRHLTPSRAGINIRPGLLASSGPARPASTVAVRMLSSSSRVCGSSRSSAIHAAESVRLGGGHWAGAQSLARAR